MHKQVLHTEYELVYNKYISTAPLIIKKWVALTFSVDIDFAIVVLSNFVGISK